MLQRSSSLRFKKALQSVLAVAALGLTAGAASAQYGTLPRLGGPIVIADYSSGTYGGYSAPYAGSAFGYNGYSNGYTSAGFSNLPRNIAFDGTGTFGFGVAANNTATGTNQLINDPLLGFQQPRQIVVPTASGFVDANGNPVSLSNITSGFNSSNVFVGNSGLNGNTSLNDATVTTGNTGTVDTTANVNTGFSNPVVITPSAIGTSGSSINPNALIGQPSGTSATWLGSNAANINATALVNGGFPAAFNFSTQAMTPGRIGNVAVNPNATIGQPSSSAASFLANQFGVPSGRIISQPNRLIGQPSSTSATWLGRSGSFGIQSSLPTAVRTR